LYGTQLLQNGDAWRWLNMNCYLINKETNIVENTIVADPLIDIAPEGYELVPVVELQIIEQPTQISADV